MIALCVGLVEKLRGDYQRRIGLARLFGGGFGTVQVGLRIAQATVHDDHHAGDMGQRLAPVLAYTQA